MVAFVSLIAAIVAPTEPSLSTVPPSSSVQEPSGTDVAKQRVFLHDSLAGFVAPNPVPTTAAAVSEYNQILGGLQALGC